MEIGGLLLNFGTLGFCCGFRLHLGPRDRKNIANPIPPKSSLSRDGIEERLQAKATIK